MFTILWKDKTPPRLSNLQLTLGFNFFIFSYHSIGKVMSAFRFHLLLFPVLEISFRHRLNIPLIYASCMVTEVNFRFETLHSAGWLFIFSLSTLLSIWWCFCWLSTISFFSCCLSCSWNEFTVCRPLVIAWTRLSRHFSPEVYRIWHSCHAVSFRLFPFCCTKLYIRNKSYLLIRILLFIYSTITIYK